MRRAIALATILALSLGGVASAETWTKYVDAANGIAWSYDADYAYRDRATGRIVVMQAISKPAASLGPSGPGKPDGVGSIVAIDCGKKNMLTLANYSPSKPLDIKATWRSDTPKKAEGAENQALVSAVCALTDKLASK
jgi:hypothetical protein